MKPKTCNYKNIQEDIADCLKKGLPLVVLVLSLFIATGCDKFKDVCKDAKRAVYRMIYPKHTAGIVVISAEEAEQNELPEDSDGLPEGSDEQEEESEEQEEEPVEKAEEEEQRYIY